MKSILTEAELSILLMDNKKYQKKPIKPKEEFFVIGKIPISSLINNEKFSFDSHSSIPLCEDLLPYLDFQLKANEVLTPQALKNLSKTLIIDLRAKQDYEAGKIPGAINMSTSSLSSLNTYSLRSQENITLYCCDGKTSLKALLFLKFLGFKNANVLLGGYANWMISG